jgi:ABC-2 type transport system ATP-binding protein
VLDQVGMLERSDSLISSLSKGMRQRVGLAQAMVHEPDVLVLDEPTIGLDPGQVREFRELIKEVGQKHTVLLSTHILSEVEQVCSRVLIIHNGKIVAEDRPDALSTRLQGSHRFRVQVGNVKPETVAEVIGGLPGIISAQPGELGIEVMSREDQDTRPAVAAAIVGKKWDLLELRPLDMSLEDIFLELTTNDHLANEEEG